MFIKLHEAVNQVPISWEASAFITAVGWVCKICKMTPSALLWHLRWWWRKGMAEEIHSLAPGGFENIFQNVFFKLISWIDTLSNSCETALRSMPQNPSDDKSTLVQVMAWCRQAASHYLSQCCPRSLSPYGVTRPQWVNMSYYCLQLNVGLAKYVLQNCHETLQIFNWYSH